MIQSALVNISKLTNHAINTQLNQSVLFILENQNKCYNKSAQTNLQCSSTL